MLEANPRGLLLPRIYLTPPDWWVQANLVECQVLSHGGKNYRLGLGHGRDGKAFPSLASSKWRADTTAALRQVIAHVRAKGVFESLQVSYVPGPGCPEPFYLRAGFRHTGRVDEGEVVLELPLGSDAG